MYALLLALTFAAYSPVLHYSFLRFDDSTYVTYNPQVTTGLSWDNLLWAFRTGYASNWHPLTWLSHMLDVQLFGLRAGWHHAVNLLLHCANVLLLGTLLQRFTGGRWQSLFVAALFALHPLHVESVAWIAERKDLLTTFFFLLTLQMYCRYVTVASHPRRRSSWYFASVICFALALLSKPMAVSLPFVLFLIDFWPLRRCAGEGGSFSPRPVGKLIFEKVPFFCLSAAAAWITFRVQSGGKAVAADLSWSDRLNNALHSYALYLWKMIWPLDLAIFYPHPNIGGAATTPNLDGPAWLVLVLIVLATGFVIMVARRLPWLPVGWFWYLGTLIPVLGLVQAGGQAMADRYTYIPLIGVFICIAWGAGSVQAALKPKEWAVLATIVIVACLFLSYQQVGTWKDNLTVFQHALRVTRNNAVAHNQVGIELAEAGHLEEALLHFREAFSADPSSAEARFGQGYCLEKMSRQAEAVAEYSAALEIKPGYWLARIRLAGLYWDLGARDKAVSQYQAALRQNPADALGQFRLGIAAQEQGDMKTAAAAFAEAVRFRPGDGDALQRLAESLLQLGRLPEAARAYSQLVAAFPKLAEPRINYGGVLWRLGNREAALLQYAEAVRLEPGNVLAQSNLGFAQAGLGRLEEASRAYTEAIRLQPQNAESLAALGRIKLRLGKAPEGVNLFRKALLVKPDPQFFFSLGLGETAAGNAEAALQAYAEAAKLQPQWAAPLAESAWILATDARTSVRNGNEALRLAQRARDLAGGKDPRSLAAYEVACAELGRFEDAIKAAQEVREIATSSGEQAMARAAEARIALYQRGQAYREEATGQ